MSPVLSWAQKTIIWNTTLHIGNGSVLNNSTLIFENGKISQIITEPFDSSGKKVINASNKHVYPGFIAPYSILGLNEIESVRGQQDAQEVGEVNPNVRTLIAFNTDSDIIPTVKKNGVLMAQITPRGELFTGTSSVVVLDGNNWEEANYLADKGIHLVWPSKYFGNYWWEDFSQKPNENYDKQLQTIDKIVTDAQNYAKTPIIKTKNLKLDALKGLFDSSKTLYIYAQTSSQIIDAVSYFEKKSISKIVIVGALDCTEAIPFLSKHKIPVIFTRVHSLPPNSNSDIYQAYKMPKLLKDAGILYALSYDGDMEAMGTRNLPFTAGTTVAYGLTQEEALMSITYNTAKILGIDKTCGSLEIGKDATLFISDGDALDILTNNLTHAWIKGNRQSLRSKQDDLYEKYKK